MAVSQVGQATVNTSGIPIVTSGTTTSSTRDVTSVISPSGTNLSIVKMRVPYMRRKIESEKKFLFFLATQPKYIPKVGQKVLIHHLDFPASGSLHDYFTTKSTNVAVGSFVQLAFMTGTNTVALRDNFQYALEVTYDDDTLGYIAGDCNGVIEYETSPLAYEILKPIESNVVVTERVPYDLAEGDNYLVGSTTGTGQTRTDIAPMLFVNRGDSNTVFSNLYKSFNLPVTDSELKEFEQSTLGYFTVSTSGNLYHDGQKGYWTSGGTANMIHPVTGYTGMFYGTAYQYLAQDRVLVMEIPQAQYGEIIDGKSLKIKIPYCTVGSLTCNSFYEIYGAFKSNPDEYALGKMDNYMSEHDFSASYFGNPAVYSDAGYESNVVLLFSDIYPPATGSITSWATGHQEVMDGEKVYNPNAVTKKAFFDFYLDKPVGIAFLDRGFVVITDPTIVDRVYQIYDASSHNRVDVASNIIVNYDGSNLDWFNSQFLFKSTYLLDPEVHFAEFLSYNTERSMNVVCLASANEFFRTTNSTAKVLMNATTSDYAEFKNPVSGNLYPIVITEIGLHDAQGNLLAIVKPTEPIKKYWYDVVSFNIKIRL